MAYSLSFIIKSLHIVYLAIQLQLAKSVGRYTLGIHIQLILYKSK